MADPLADTRASIASDYPALAPHLANTEISYGDPTQAQGRGLEFYPPWETDNPTPGKTHVQIFDRNLSNDETKSAIAGDMLHLIGAKDPSTGAPVDSKFRDLRDQFANTITSEQRAIDTRAYARDVSAYGADNVGNIKDWMERSRLDAYIRGNLFPDRADNWKGHYTDEQSKILDRMKAYLKGLE